jgi:ParB-like chromosome segregation protein Spo0J
MTKVDRKLKVKRVPIGSIIADPSNVRSHNSKNLGAIRESLKRFGQVEPLVVQSSTRIVIGGNGRLEAMKEIGWDTVEIVEVDINHVEANALAITLNRTAELGEWNDEALSAVLKSYSESQPEAKAELTLLGWDADDLKALLGTSAEDEKPKGGQDESGKLKPQFQILINCADEPAQVALLDRLSEEGFQCKALVA